MPGGQPTGPMGLDDLRSGLSAGRIAPHALACPVGGDAWVPVQQVLGPAPVPPPPSWGVPAPATSPALVAEVPEAYTAYVPSGRMGPNWWVVPLLGLAAAFVAGGIYGWLNYYNPIVGILTLFIAGGAGLAVGVVIAKLGKPWKIRNPKVAAVIGAVCGLTLSYFCWTSFLSVLIWARAGQPLVPTWFECAFSPFQAMRFALWELLPEGWFNIHRIKVSGIFLLVGWIVEFGAFVIPVLGLALVGAQEPFSERSDRWFDETELQRPFLLPGTDAATASTVDPRALSGLVPGDPAAPHLAVKLYTLPDDPAQALVAVERRAPKPNKKAKSDDKIEYEKKEILAAHWIPGDLAQQLMALKA